MNFKEAEDRLSALAPGKYRSVEYKTTIFHTGDKVQECELYVDGPGLVHADTWAGAFELMEKKITGSLIGADIQPETVEELTDEQAYLEGYDGDEL